MDRQTVYPGQILPETVLLQMAKDSMIGVAKLSSALFGTSTMANGFAVTPTGPASLQVLVAPGEIYSLTSIDATAYSSLAADTTHSIMKQGILLDGLTLSCPAPGTTGQSINYLVQATYQDLDANPVLLPYYNSANPALPFSGIGNNGLTQNTSRKGAALVAVKAGASATTGSQTTPAPDAGYVGLYVVTVAFGQTTITSASISQYASAPLLPAGLVPAVQSSAMTSAQDFGTANTYKANYTPAITVLSNNFVLEFEVLTANTGASTFSPNGLTAAPIIGSAHSALQGGELVAGGKAEVIWSVTLGSWVLLGCTGGSLQVGTATKSQHAVQLGQVAALVGGVRNGKMSVSAASTTATFTADELVVKTALGGSAWLLPSFSKVCNLATTGAGGMDAGTAPVSGFVALYAIYNPTTQVSALLAVNATSVKPPEVYGGANMPAGYIASALVSTWKTNASGQFIAGFQVDRRVIPARTQVLNTSTAAASLTTLSISSAVPLNASRIYGETEISSGAGSLNSAILASDSTGAGFQFLSSSPSSSITGNFTLNLNIAQTMFYQMTVSTTPGSFSLYITSYEF
jgi:hypothetical protein